MVILHTGKLSDKLVFQLGEECSLLEDSTSPMLLLTRDEETETQSCTGGTLALLGSSSRNTYQFNPLCCCTAARGQSGVWVLLCPDRFVLMIPLVSISLGQQKELKEKEAC